MMNSKYDLGDIINIEITTKDFGRIAAQRARNVIVQAINESERDAIYDHFYTKREGYHHRYRSEICWKQHQCQSG